MYIYICIFIYICIYLYIYIYPDVICNEEHRGKGEAIVTRMLQYVGHASGHAGAAELHR